MLNTKISNEILNNTSAFSDFRKSFVVCIKIWRSTVLPENHCWANGDFRQAGRMSNKKILRYCL